MGCGSHLCWSPLTDDASTFYSCITWWHSRGTDVFKWIYRELWRERDGVPLFFCHFARRKVISCTARGSKPRNKQFQSLSVVKQHVRDYKITHAYSLLCKLLWALQGLYDFVFNYTVSSVTLQVFIPLSLFLNIKSITALALN